MRTCYVVPGILGSSLHTPDNEDYPDQALWVSVERLALGEFPGLTLDPNGTGPGPPDGELCRAGGPLPQAYRTLTLTLASGLAKDGYQVRTWGYDWRKNIFPEGERLAADIRNFATLEDPCSIVAHSQGGLVARCAWVALFQTGQTGLVRRIVTLATPHRGSYAPVMVWSLNEDLISQLSYYSNLLAGLGTIEQTVQALKYSSPLDLMRVTATWPSMYELLPLIDRLSIVGDPYRPLLFEAGRWPSNRQLSSLHFSRSKDNFQALMRAPPSMPPPEVLTTVAGTGFRTPFQLIHPGLLGTTGAIGFTEYGDGRVAQDSANVLPGTAFVVASTHADLALQPNILAQLPALVLAVRSPGPVPTVAEEQLDHGLSIGAGPPFHSAGIMQHDC